MTTLTDFRATRQAVDDLGKEFGDPALRGSRGFAYRTSGRDWVAIAVHPVGPDEIGFGVSPKRNGQSRPEWTEQNLAAYEELLYTIAVGDGRIKREVILNWTAIGFAAFVGALAGAGMVAILGAFLT